jgi:hypothetical protein
MNRFGEKGSRFQNLTIVRTTSVIHGAFITTQMERNRMEVKLLSFSITSMQIEVLFYEIHSIHNSYQKRQKKNAMTYFIRKYLTKLCFEHVGPV